MNVVQYRCKDCGHCSKMSLQAREYNPDVFCSVDGGNMQKYVLAYVKGLDEV